MKRFWRIKEAYPPQSHPWVLGPVVSLLIAVVSLTWAYDYITLGGPVPDDHLATPSGWAALLAASGLWLGVASVSQLVAVKMTGLVPWAASIAAALGHLAATGVFLSLAGAVAMAVPSFGTGQRSVAMALSLAALNALRLWFTVTIDLVQPPREEEGDVDTGEIS